MKTMLITGANGMLGSAAKEYFGDHYKCVGLDSAEGSDYCVDITDHNAVRKVFDEIKPDIVLHCAAMISPELCEDMAFKAYQVNSEATGNLAFLCNQYKSRMVYISTNMVFDGKKKKPYTEEDEPRFINEYGYTKYWGEVLIEKYLREYLIVRTNIFGTKPGAYGDWLVKTLKENKPRVHMFSNLYFNCLYVKDFLDFLRFPIQRGTTGKWHITSRDYMSKYDFALKVNNIMGRPYKHKLASGCIYTEINGGVRRPEFAVLDCSKYETEFGIRLPTMQESAQRFWYDYIGYVPYSDGMR